MGGPEVKATPVMTGGTRTFWRSSAATAVWVSAASTVVSGRLMVPPLSSSANLSMAMPSRSWSSDVVR